MIQTKSIRALSAVAIASSALFAVTPQGVSAAETPDAGVYFAGETQVYMSLTDIVFNNEKFTDYLNSVSKSEIHVLLSEGQYGNLYDLLFKKQTYQTYKDGDIPAVEYTDLDGNSVIVNTSEEAIEFKVEDIY